MSIALMGFPAIAVTVDNLASLRQSVMFQIAGEVTKPAQDAAATEGVATDGTALKENWRARKDSNL